MNTATRMASACIALGILFGSSEGSPADTFTNSLSMEMIRIEAGSFRMGAITAEFSMEPDDDMSKNAPYWDETPVHEVTITYPFYISETEVTIEQYRRFRRDYSGTGFFEPYVSGVSWNEAVAFCEWLSEQEDEPYRLPTEAEWEFVCRAGTETPFWSGDDLPVDDVNQWGVRNLHSGVPEWCSDWHGEYPATGLVDPVGYDQGWGRVVRGGSLATEDIPPDNEEEILDFRPISVPVFYRSANRGSMIPDCPQVASRGRRPHFIGFRVVKAALPDTAPLRADGSFPLQGVRQTEADWSVGPDSTKPYFKARQIISSPPDLTLPRETHAVGLDRAVEGKIHSGGITYCPNGDLIAISFSSRRGKSEAGPNTTMVITRLRQGSDEWDLPALFYDLSCVNDQSGLLWNDDGTIWFFGGGRHHGDIPFKYTRSTDSGATWSELTAPVITGPQKAFEAQPINSAFRDPAGTIYFGSDAKGGESFLWASKDEGATWYDTLGRTCGRHTTFVQLADGRILGFGGKNTDIYGYMPKCYSSDNGKTWSEATKSPFAAMGSNQRPTVLRLASGRLFFTGDYQNIRMLNNPPPTNIIDRGSYVALSDDEGGTWTVKKLHMAPKHNDWNGTISPERKPQQYHGTVGYSDAVQTPDGVIHMMTSKGTPSMHFAMNEAWILSDASDEENNMPGTPDASRIERYEEKHPNGRAKATSSGYVGRNGVYFLHGVETWYYDSGRKQYEATFRNGTKAGVESYWRRDGSLAWIRDHTIYGTIVWTRYRPDGGRESESHWCGHNAWGPTTVWDELGNVVTELYFENGRLMDEKHYKEL
jgi:formylglycine-generating enzyme required for sulfatase activity